jgi:hypothetical protein
MWQPMVGCVMWQPMVGSPVAAVMVSRCVMWQPMVGSPVAAVMVWKLVIVDHTRRRTSSVLRLAVRHGPCFSVGAGTQEAGTLINSAIQPPVILDRLGGRDAGNDARNASNPDRLPGIRKARHHLRPQQPNYPLDLAIRDARLSACLTLTTLSPRGLCRWGLRVASTPTRAPLSRGTHT